MKRRPFNLTIISQDEIGEKETFQVPDSALYFETIQAIVREDMKHDVLLQDLALKAMDEGLASDVLIHDLDDKIMVVERLRKTGQWGRKMEKVRK